METPKTFKELFANTGIDPTTDESGNTHYNFKATMKEAAKQTAVQWYAAQLQSKEQFTQEEFDSITNQAKEMEKQQKAYSEEEVDFFVKNILHHIKYYEYNVNNLELISFSNDIESEIEKLYEQFKNK